MNLAQLQTILPRAPRAWLEAIVSEVPRLLANLDTPEEQASFLAQIAHESAELTRIEENLNYSAERLMQVWPRRFPTLEHARQFERNPERLANYVYALRLGNGPPESGDGWRYHGRGPIQITGKHNYLLCGDWLGLDLGRHPELLLEPKHGIASACWYWIYKDLDSYDDDADVAAETKLINGSELGLKQRQIYFDRALAVLTAPADLAAPAATVVASTTSAAQYLVQASPGQALPVGTKLYLRP